MNFWSAMELSRRVVSRHWFTILGLLLLTWLVAAAGILLCCVGILATILLALLSMMYAYEDIFGRRTTGEG